MQVLLLQRRLDPKLLGQPELGTLGRSPIGRGQHSGFDQALGIGDLPAQEPLQHDELDRWV